jgi:hypothetical protein
MNLCLSSAKKLSMGIHGGILKECRFLRVTGVPGSL